MIEWPVVVPVVEFIGATRDAFVKAMKSMRCVTPANVQEPLSPTVWKRRRVDYAGAPGNAVTFNIRRMASSGRAPAAGHVGLIDATEFFHTFADNAALAWRDEHIIPRYNAMGVTRFAFHVPPG